MSFIDCIKGKGLSASEIQKLSDTYSELVEQYSKGNSEADAVALAASNIVAMEAKRVADTKRATMKQAIMTSMLREKNEIAYKAATDAYGELNKAAKFFTPKPSRAQVAGELYEKAFIRGEGLFKEYFIQMEDAVNAMAAKNLGFSQDYAAARSITKQVIDGNFEGDTGAMAKSVRDIFERLNREHNQAGGVMGRIDNYFPQVHDGTIIKDYSFDEWWAFTKDKLDRDKMLDPSTGLPFTDAKLREVANESYLDITTNGMHSINKAYGGGASRISGGGDISARRSQRRFFHFKDGDNFLAYNDKFGSGKTGLFDGMVAHIQGLTRDIGMMQTLGPKSKGTAEMMNIWMEGETGAKQKQKLANGMFTVLSGAGGNYGYESPLYKGVVGMQNIMRSSMLGGASISAISDSVFVKMAADMNGLDGTKALKNYMSSTWNKEERVLVNNAAHIAEMASHSGVSAARLFDGTGSQRQGKTAFLAGLTNRMSGLQAMTIAAEDAVSLALSGDVADYVLKKTSWADLPADFKRSAIKHGFNEGDWEVISSVTPLATGRGSRFTTAEELAKADVEVARKFADWDMQLRYLSTNAPTLKFRALSTGAAMGDGSYGSFTRAVTSSLFMFKSFPVNMMMNYLLPSLSQAAQGKPASFMTMAIGGTVMGSIALQAKQMVMGRDPRDMDDGKFWAAAAIQGGGLGLFGDYLFNDQGRFGRSFISDMIGPMGGFAEDVGRVFTGNFQGALTDEDWDGNKMWGDLTKFTQRYTPAASLWYIRTPLERMIFETVNDMGNDNFQRQARKTARKYEKDFGQKQWWKSGNKLPSRAPDLGAANIDEAASSIAPSF